MYCDSPLEAELQACIDGLEKAIHFSTLPIIIETDCVHLAEAANSKAMDRSSYLHLVTEIRRLASQDRIYVFVKVERSQVRVSHCLANLARAELCTKTWLGSAPDVVLQELENDLCVSLPE